MLPSFLRGTFASFSDHVVYSSSLYEGMRSQITEMGSALIDFERDPRSDSDRRCRRCAELLHPFDVDVPLIRVGGSADGAYVMADLFDTAGAISLGVGHDVSWDIDIASRGISVHMFDPTVAGPPVVFPRGTFHAVGIGTPSQAAATGLPLRSLEDLVALAEFEIGHDLLLKMDVEGAEWEALETAADLSRYSQVVLELHNLERLDDELHGGQMLRVLNRLAESHVPIHIHANNDAPLAHFDAYWFPTVLEVSFLRRDAATGARPATSLREDLDAPSNPRFADLSLRGLLSL